MTSIADYTGWRHIANAGITPPATGSTTLWTVSTHPIRAVVSIHVTSVLGGSVNFTISTGSNNLCNATACPTAPGSLFVPVTFNAGAETSASEGILTPTADTLFDIQPGAITLTTSATVSGTIVAEIFYLPYGNATVS